MFKYVLLTPSLLLVGVLVALPLLVALGATFTDWILFGAASMSFVGLDNWIELPTTDAWVTARNTLVFVGLAVPTSVVVTLAVSVSLAGVRRGRVLFESLFILPLFVMPVGLTVTARMMLNPQVGPINALIAAFGIEPPSWLSEAVPATLAIVAIDVWASSAFMILLITAGLKSLPDELYEAAEVDGASWWASFSRITLPLIAPVLLVVTILKTIVTFHIADIPLALTGGGPGNATEPLSLTVYATGVEQGKMAVASTQAYFLLFLMSAAILGLIVVTRPVRRRWAA